MNRFRKAWLALRNRLEPEVRTVEKVVERTMLVPAGENMATVYRATSKAHRSALDHHKFLMDMYRTTRMYDGLALAYGGNRRARDPEPVPPKPPEWEGRLYRSCAEVFAAHGEDAEASAIKALVVGDKAYCIGWLTEHELQPKPKKAKGKR